MANRIVLCLVSILMLQCSYPEDSSDLLEELMKERPEEFTSILQNLEGYEVQVIYTQVDRDSLNQPRFTRYELNTDPSRYFYPASTVKMPIAFMAMEAVNDLAGVTMHTPMITDSLYGGQSRVLYDSTTENNLPSIDSYVKKIFLVSDNDAFNRLYELVGQKEIANRLKSLGYSDARIIHRLSIALSEEENRNTNPVYFIESGDTLAMVPGRFNNEPHNTSGPLMKGIGYQKGEKIIEAPFDFGQKNFISLHDLTDILMSVVFPTTAEGFNLSDEQRIRALTYMSQLPRESAYPKYDSTYFDAYCKFLMFGSDPKAEIPDHIRVFNKIGLAYGYTTDISYVVDAKNNIEFLLSATIHTNKNKIYNDGKYEYDEVAFPFMRDIGQMIYRYELNRHREYPPDLTEFKNLKYK